MCGIVGVVNLDGTPASAELAEAMLGWMEHRGPDETGTRADGQVAFGTARLSVIDLSTGSQPIPNEDESVWVCFNGEIYNFVELRNELEQDGHRFRTRTDTEVIVHAYEKWGDGFVKRLKGMFGLALIDLTRRIVYLARDPMGEKPLFYAARPEFFAFASEIKPLLQELPLSRELDPLALQSYFAFARPVGDLCAFRSVRKLLPGELLKLDMASGKTTVESYWTPPAGKLETSLEEAEEELLERLEDAVQRFLVADVPVGAFLSGGTDSSAVVAMMRRFFDHPVKTFTAVYEDPHISEAGEARRVSDLLGTDHHEVHVGPRDVAETLPELVWHLEEPFADASFVPTYFVSKKAREHVKVALTGDGGDELFGGYDSYRAFRLLEYYRRLPGHLRGAVRLAVNRVPTSVFTGTPRIYYYLMGGRRVVNTPTDHDEVAAFIGLTGEAALPSLVPPEALEALLDRRRGSLDGYTGSGSVDRVMYFQLRGLLPELFFTKVDRMSMANSLEARSPLVYRDIAEFAISLPTSYKVRGGQGKYLLKRAFSRYLPKDILYRPKKGFTIPLYRWLREDPRLRSFVEYYALGAGSRLIEEHAGVNAEVIRSHTRGFLAREHNRWSLPWKALCFGVWWQTFVDGDGSSPLGSVELAGVSAG